MAETSGTANPTPELKREIKELIITTLKLPDITPDDIGDTVSLFDRNGTLGIDSVDALEIVMMLQRTYGVRIDNNHPARFIVSTVDSIAEFIARERTDSKNST
jgi:acyl carrier protein